MAASIPMDWLTVAILFDDGSSLDIYSHSPALLSDISSPTNDSELVWPARRSHCHSRHPPPNLPMISLMAYQRIGSSGASFSPSHCPSF